jgi:hypothetical protein
MKPCRPPSIQVLFLILPTIKVDSFLGTSPIRQRFFPITATSSSPPKLGRLVQVQAVVDDSLYSELRESEYDEIPYPSSLENDIVEDLVNPRKNLLSWNDESVMSMTSTEEAPRISEKLVEAFSQVVIVGLGTLWVSAMIGGLLMQFEWLQDWRYFWPLVGGLFVADPMLSIILGGDGERQSSSSLLPFSLSTNAGVRILSIIGGLLSVLGGAYDAFMPVWQTGPNVFTIAGIGQDGAVMLLVVSIVSILQDCWKAESSSSTRMLLQIVLLAELCKLGESSIDEIASAIGSLSTIVT